MNANSYLFRRLTTTAMFALAVPSSLNFDDRFHGRISPWLLQKVYHNASRVAIGSRLRGNPFWSACLLVLLTGLLFTRAARATETNIVYAFSATTSINDAIGNYVGTAPANLIYFTNRAFTVRIFADTNTVYEWSDAGPGVDAVDALAATIEVAGIGTVDLDAGYRITLFINRTVRAMGTSQPVGKNFGLTLSTAQAGQVDLRRPFGPIVLPAYDGYMVYWNTNGNSVVRCVFSPNNSATPSMTVEARLWRPPMTPPRVDQFRLGDGGAVLDCSGPADVAYDIQRAIQVTGPWTNLIRRTTSGSGRFSFTNTSLPNPAAFYRLQQH